MLRLRSRAVADTYDAICSTRAYRKASLGDKAMRIINEVAGSQLDPQIVELFNTIFSNELKS